MVIRFTINGEEHEFHGDPRTSLLNALRDTFRLTGGKAACSEGFCGACTVHIGGELAVGCLKAIGTLEGKQITTIEGIGNHDKLNHVQQAFEDHDVVQCGMCFPGMVMTFTHLLEKNSNPSREEVRSAMSGNICRCTGYERIIDAIMSIKADGGQLQ